MTAVQARRAAEILRDLAATEEWDKRAELYLLAKTLERYAEWKQIAEAPPMDERGAGWTA